MSGSNKKRPRAPSLPSATPPASHKKPKHAESKKALTFSHEEFQPRAMQSGSGLKYHEFSNVSFGGPGHPDPRASSQAYIKNTGLTPIDTPPSWGHPVPSTAPMDQPKMYRSRRGSISGLAPMPDGSVKGWRLHSLPTSEALRDQTVTSSTQFQQSFDARAEKLSTPAVNTKGNEQSVNTVLSDFGKVRFDSTQGAFQFSDATHAMGVSGKGMDNKQSSKPQEMYAPSIEVAKQDGKSGSAAQTYHSEPMAITLHNQARTTKLENESGMVGTFASFPNQVCFQCGRMFQEKIGTDAVVTGVPGRPFGGQKEGDTFSPITRTTVSRAAPMSELRTSKTNTTEVGQIYDYHKRS